MMLVHPFKGILGRFFLLHPNWVLHRVGGGAHTVLISKLHRTFQVGDLTKEFFREDVEEEVIGQVTQLEQPYQSLVFSHEVADNTVASTVTWTAILQYDSEPEYDFTYLEVNRGGEWQELRAFDCQGITAIAETIVVAPEESFVQMLQEYAEGSDYTS